MIAATTRQSIYLAAGARSFTSTAARHHFASGWIDKVKTLVYGPTSTPNPSTKPSFSLLDFAKQVDRVRQLGTLKNPNQATLSNSIVKHTNILRYLASIDPSGEKLTSGHKKDAVKHCGCTIADVEHVLAKFQWAKEAQAKLDKLKQEGKPMPKTFNEMKKLVGTTPVDIGRSNLANTGQLSRNAPCPCGSGKRYKRCCGETTAA